VKTGKKRGQKRGQAAIFIVSKGNMLQNYVFDIHMPYEMNRRVAEVGQIPGFFSSSTRIK
jgi:hypothetical protein